MLLPTAVVLACMGLASEIWNRTSLPIELRAVVRVLAISSVGISVAIATLKYNIFEASDAPRCSLSSL